MITRDNSDPGELSRYSDRLNNRDIGVPFAARARDFCRLHSVQTGSGVHTAYYPMGTGGALSSGVKRSVCEADHSRPTTAEVKNAGAMPPLPYTSS
jgi:hypothetical protein